MKSKLAALALLTSFTFSCKTSKNKVYTIIKPSSPRLENRLIDTVTLNSLSEPMKAVAYSYFSSTMVVSKAKSQQTLKTSLVATRNKYITSLKLSQDKDTITESYAYDTLLDGQILSHSHDDMYILNGKSLKRID